MKFHELSTDRALDVMCELTPYASSICNDSELINTLGEKIDVVENMNMYGKFMLLVDHICKVAPILLKTHRPDVYGILSVVNEKTAAEIAAQPIMDTIRQVREVFQDSEFISFFKSSAQAEQSVNGE